MMSIFDDAPVSIGPIGTARGDYRYFTFKGNEGFEHSVDAADGGPRFLSLLRGCDTHLTLAVVAEIRGLEDRGTSEREHRIG